MRNQSNLATPLLLLFALTILIISAPHARAQADASPAEQALLQLANQARAQHNIPPLQWDSSLARAAHAHLRWVIRNPGDFSSPATTVLDPNPVVAELQPAGPPPKSAGKTVLKPKKPKPPKTTAAAPEGSPFPDSSQAPPPR